VTKPSSFFSLSGFSGLFIGIYCFLALFTIRFLTNDYSSGEVMSSMLPVLFIEVFVVVTTILFIILSVFTLWIRARRKAKKSTTILWNPLSKKLRLHLLTPLLFISIVLILIANYGYYNLITPLALFFYGMLLLNLSRFTHKRLKLLAGIEIILAILAYFIYDNELLFLILGFGLFHMLYGMLTLGKKK
tara:strand:- start:437828 stop:438394 length:567 start_codon:yes stop_codon:yes gene_type:complete